MAEWFFKALGGASLRHGERLYALERKTAAILCYLALEGATPRSRLAGLLWAESPENTARSNLRQALRRLRTLTGADLLTAADPLSLSPELEVDAARLQVAGFLGESGSVASLTDTLLPGFSYEDCPEFADWLLAERERLTHLKRDTLAAEARRLETAGDYRGALEWTERLLALDPVSEALYRQSMRLHYLLGDRAAALKRFEEGVMVLERELGVRPLAETLALAEEIRRGLSLPERLPERPTIPETVLNPPHLAGRAREWAQLERAYRDGCVVYLQGEAGVGKSRLMQDFAAAQGVYVRLEARPGDAGVPFATLTRFIRGLLPQGLTLEPWVRQELARLLPELSTEAPPPLQSQRERLRLFEAFSSLWRDLGNDIATVIMDDFHAMDSSSLEASAYLLAQAALPGERPLRVIASLRPNELRPDTDAHMRSLLEMNRAVLLTLEPLDEAGVAELLAGLNLPALPAASPLSRYTGGNPLFIVETLKTLIETGDLGTQLPPGLPPPGRVKSLLSRRLEHLSPVASRLVQVAAVAIDDFSLELSARILGANERLPDAYGELEAAQILPHGRFSHDLLRETVLTGIPEPIRALLHRRIFEALRETALPATLARHAGGAGLLEETFRYSLLAGESAVRLFALRNALEHYEGAHGVVRALAESFKERLALADLQRLYERLGFCYIYTGELENARTLYQEVFTLARRAILKPLEWAALNHLAYLAVHDGYNLERADGLLEEALRIAESYGDATLRAEAVTEAAGLYALALEPARALPHAERAIELNKALLTSAAADAPKTRHARSLLARSLNEYENTLWQLGRWDEAEAPLEEAAGHYRLLGQPTMEARMGWIRGYDHIASGRTESGIALLREALELIRRHDDRRGEVNALGILSVGLSETGALREAQESAQRAIELALTFDIPILRILCLSRVARLYLLTGDLPLARNRLLEALELNDTLPRRPRTAELCLPLLNIALYEGNLADARRYLEQAQEARDLPYVDPFTARAPLVRLLLRDNRTPEAESLLSGYEAYSRGNPRHRLEYLRALAAMQEAQGQAAAAFATLSDALSLTLTLPNERWRVQAERRRLGRSLGQKGEGLEAEREAQTLVQQLAGELEPDRRKHLHALAERLLGLEPA